MNLKVKWNLIALSTCIFGINSTIAAEQSIQMDAVFNNMAAEAFGSTAATQSVLLNIVFDDADTGIVEISAGSQVASGGEVAANNLLMIPASALISFDATIGSGAWNLVGNIVDQTLLGGAAPFAVIVEGGIEYPQGVIMQVSGAAGIIYTAQYACSSASFSCSAIDGFAFDTSSGAMGTISDQLVEISSSDSALDPDDILLHLQILSEELGMNSMLLDTVAAKSSTKSSQHPAAVNKLEAFINKVEAQYGKKIPADLAEEMIVLAEMLIEILTSGQPSI